MNLSVMTYGAILSAVLATVLVVFLARDRRPAVLILAAASALVAPACWNTILRLTGATGAFSHDPPFRPFPISWQDVGSGVFTLALASTAFALGAATDLPRRVAVLAAWTALAALLVDIYLY
jgi:hypothetical protein